MPEYDYKDPESEDRISIWSPMADSVPCGTMISKYGRKWMRVPSKLRRPKVWSRRIESKSIELNHPDAPHLNAKGEACFQSQSEINEFCAKTGRSYE